MAKSTKTRSQKSAKQKHVTKISASATKNQSNSKPQSNTKANANAPKTKQDLKSDKTKAKINKAAAKASAKPNKSADQPSEKPLKKVFILARPFVAFGRYLRDSWRELSQVRWPNRKLTWKMVLAVFIYCAFFMIFVVILDGFFTFLFNKLLGQ